MHTGAPIIHTGKGNTETDPAIFLFYLGIRSKLKLSLKVFTMTYTHRTDDVKNLSMEYFIKRLASWSFIHTALNAAVPFKQNNVLNAVPSLKQKCIEYEVVYHNL
jgi:hypothetical protein